MSEADLNRYAEFLRACGANVGLVDDIAWFEYNGFLRPAYLPHAVPAITRLIARQAIAQLGGLFSRWDTGFGVVADSPWWYIVRSGPYSLEQVSGNTRSKIRRGLKRLEARKISVDEVQEQGLGVCRKAVSRYGQTHFMPEPSEFKLKLEAVRQFPDCCEYFGVYRGEQLVGFSENHLQDGAVFWESIWYDPEALRDYSSYVLCHAMLDQYLNSQGAKYVSDGSRTLYHETGVHSFLVDKFGFGKMFAHLGVEYSTMIGLVIRTLVPFGRVLSFLDSKTGIDTIARLRGLVLQESIARACKDEPE